MDSSSIVPAKREPQDSTKESAPSSKPSGSKNKPYLEWMCSTSPTCWKRYKTLGTWRRHESANVYSWSCTISDCRTLGIFSSERALRQHLGEVHGLAANQISDVLSRPCSTLRDDVHPRLFEICPVYQCAHGQFANLKARQEHIRDSHLTTFRRNWAGDSADEFWDNVATAHWNMIEYSVPATLRRTASEPSNASGESSSSGGTIAEASYSRQETGHLGSDSTCPLMRANNVSAQDLGQAWALEYIYNYLRVSCIPAEVIHRLQQQEGVDEVSARHILLARRIDDGSTGQRTRNGHDGSTELLSDLATKFTSMSLLSTEHRETSDAARSAPQVSPRPGSQLDDSASSSATSPTCSDFSSKTNMEREPFSGGSAPWCHFQTTAESASSSDPPSSLEPDHKDTMSKVPRNRLRAKL